MAKSIKKLPFITLLAFLLSSNITIYADSPTNSPSPAQVPALQIPPHSPVPSPNPSPASSPSPNPSPTDEETTPAPAPVSDSGLKKDVKGGGEERESEGMSGGKKAGIALGVIGAVFILGLGGCVCKKRQRNLRRSEYSYGARSEIL